MITVVVADDHAMVRTGIVRMLDDAADISVLGQACNGEEAIQLCRKLQPTVVLMDVRMPGIGGLEATRKLCQVAPNSRIVAVSAYDQEPMPSRLMKAGASAYVSKEASEDEILAAIRQVANGRRYLSPVVAQAMALKGFDADGATPFDCLSDREMQICLMIANCHKVSEIADNLHISSKTVNSYRYRMFEKLNINGDVELTHMAIRHGLIDAPGR
ncbi:response regulator containing a CheY-like receiver domain and an HTH DNA-binding domain [Spongiibacter sp. IMCC21906]|jgi:two-component system invasion response regulator UvrY|uniref:UvrY/SirA/GacA family response regulator transcription factor n=1 Tax=Spongiibacter sp. IMCC21906 TaxID=1620392 RepID=UPI00062DD700|nr:UvrY/SirA/GacA family response regulator transcription factor [Spongiibacter sp. IMCC21906]AKH69702.1 response regulator containing a CheY-like receiver domain and an HTH DNA-binding domain [Spongiibacter sp. IMCC21906]